MIRTCQKSNFIKIGDSALVVTKNIEGETDRKFSIGFFLEDVIRDLDEGSKLSITHDAPFIGVSCSKDMAMPFLSQEVDDLYTEFSVSEHNDFSEYRDFEIVRVCPSFSQHASLIVYRYNHKNNPEVYYGCCSALSHEIDSGRLKDVIIQSIESNKSYQMPEKMGMALDDACRK